MSQDDDRDQIHDPAAPGTDDDDAIGAEGGDNDNADTLPALPSEDDDTPLGDTDQHSKVPTPPFPDR